MSVAQPDPGKCALKCDRTAPVALIVAYALKSDLPGRCSLWACFVKWVMVREIRLKVRKVHATIACGITDGAVAVAAKTHIIGYLCSVHKYCDLRCQGMSTGEQLLLCQRDESNTASKAMYTSNAWKLAPVFLASIVSSEADDAIWDLQTRENGQRANS